MSAAAGREALLARAFAAARDHWSQSLLLSPPRVGKLAGQAAIAWIDMATREVFVDFDQVEELALADSLEALLAHEIGHHLHFPGSLQVEARLLTMEKTLIPIKGYSLTNLFHDLLINQVLTPRYRAGLLAFYRAAGPGAFRLFDTQTMFYYSLYEQLWGLGPGELCGSAFGRGVLRFMDRAEADARDLVRTLPGLAPNIYTQFLYFASVFARYIRPSSNAINLLAGSSFARCNSAAPGEEDWADALAPDAAQREAVGVGVRAGWIDRDQARDLVGEDRLDRRIAGMHYALGGGGSPRAVPDAMAAFYRREAQRHLVLPRRQVPEQVRDLLPVPPPGDFSGRHEGVQRQQSLPSTLEDWEPSEPTGRIDWASTVRLRGLELGTASPLARDVIEDVAPRAPEVAGSLPRLELYLDVSPSMPNPCTTRNAMTLAAQILALAALKVGGEVRGFVYAWNSLERWAWSRSEREVSRFLLQTAGYGTRFPFPLLERSLEECGARPPVRVVITDDDFNHNVAAEPRAERLLRTAAARPGVLCLLLHRPRAGSEFHYRKLGARVQVIPDAFDLPRVAAELARTLYGPKEDARHGAA